MTRIVTLVALLAACESKAPTTIGRPLAWSGQRDDFWLTMRSRSVWMLPAEFEPIAGVSDLDLGEAEYARFSLFTTFSSEDELLTGDFSLVKHRPLVAEDARP